MTVVVKIGGARAVEPGGALADVAAVVDGEVRSVSDRRAGTARGTGDPRDDDGTDVTIVHGGSTAVDNTLERMDIEPEYVETPTGVVGRFTDEETMDVFKMALTGLVNTDLVTGLQNEGVDAVGLSGVDGRLFYGPRKSAVRVIEDGRKKIRRGDHSGRIEAVNADLLEGLLSDGYTPVVSPPMLADDGVAVNTDADRAAAAVAGTLGATLVSLTDVAGVYEDPDDESTLIGRVASPDEFDRLQEAAKGFMNRKVMAAREALEGGAPEVVVASANADDPVRNALGGGGTHIHAEALE